MASETVIIGGGFAGLYAARELVRRRRSVKLITDDPYLLYTPLLPGVTGSTLEPRHVVVALRDVLPEGVVQLGRVTKVADGEVYFVARSGEAKQLAFDRLIIASGAEPHRPKLPGIDLALGMKTVADAVNLRNRLIALLEQAEDIDDLDQRRGSLTVAVVGAGYAGIEGIAEMQDYADSLLDRYPRSRQAGMRFILIEAQERILPEVPDDVADYVSQQLRGRGIEIYLGAQLRKIEPRSILLRRQDQTRAERIPCATVVWTAGVKATVLDDQLPRNQRGQIITTPSGLVVDNIWAAGDCAAFPDPDGGLCPGTAQHAWRQGRHVAQQIINQSDRPFDYHTRGLFVDLGRHRAVARIGSLYFQGFFAWWLARSYYLLMMPTLKRKLRLIGDWTIALFFGRDSAAPELGSPDDWRPSLPTKKDD